MFSKIVVGVDSTGQGRDALKLSAVLADLTGAEVVIVHVYPSDHLEGQIVLGVSGQPLREAAKEFLAEEAEHGPRGARTLAVPGSSAARALHHAAEAENADLLIVGSSRHGTVGRVLLGDGARQAVHHAPCAVAIAPHGYASGGGPVKTIGVGFDGSPDSQLALAAAEDLARASRAKLRLVAALAPPFDGAATSVYPYPIDWSSYYEHVGERLRKDLAAALGRLDVPASGDIQSGWPPKVLEELSQTCDLLVVGSRHWGAMDRLLLGSTSSALVGHAHCPMLIVPRGAAEAPEAEKPASAAQA